VKNDIDPAFSNDNYWLLLVLHFSWDGSATVTDEGTQKLPMGNGSAKRVVVKYPSEGGYAPGDTWELYVDADNRVEEFVYHGGGPGTQKRPKLLMATWADYKKAGPLLISTDARFLFRCGRQADGIGQLGECAIKKVSRKAGR
jgi:hypothetical protein